jgi:hypothetical protein
MKTRYSVIIIASFNFFIGCEKSWLEAKPNSSLGTLSSVEDCQALLDNSSTLFNQNYPVFNEFSTSDYYLPYSVWNSRIPLIKNSYIWASDFYQGGSMVDWTLPYQQILNVNIVLNALDELKIDQSNQDAFNLAKGTAFFYRAFAFFGLAQEFCKPYIESSASTDLGIPIRLTANVNDISIRSTVQQTYDQILSDLHSAETLLANNQTPSSQLTKTRATVAAVFAMYARTYLAMSNYTKALSYSDSCLSLYNSLMDFTILSTSSPNPITNNPFNPEVIFFATSINGGLGGIAIIDSMLYQSYTANDLRRVIFFTTTTGNPTYKGSYSASNGALFAGLATDEIYLIRAECNARAGNTVLAMNDLNTLLRKRWATGTFVDYTAANAASALNQILVERRKELIFRTIRWTDLRRLNLDPQFAVTLSRNLNGQIYTFPPNDQKYVFAIPDAEIQLSGIQQNPR